MHPYLAKQKCAISLIVLEEFIIAKSNGLFDLLKKVCSLSSVYIFWCWLLYVYGMIPVGIYLQIMSLVNYM